MSLINLSCHTSRIRQTGLLQFGGHVRDVEHLVVRIDGRRFMPVHNIVSNPFYSHHVGKASLIVLR